MARKGQIELIAILGIIVVIAAVVYYVFSGGLLGYTAVPAEIAEEHRLFASSVQGLMREAALQSMRTLGLRGGYPEGTSYSLGSVEYHNRDIPYWQYNGRVSSPNVQQALVSMTNEYLNEYKGSLAGEESGIEVSDAQVTSAEFLPNKLVLKVSMPTVIKDIPVNVPYQVEIMTRFSEMEDFARNFAQFSGTERPFEHFTVAAMLQSPMDEGFQSVPIFVPSLTRCGEYVYKGYWEVQAGLDRAVKSMLGNTYLPDKIKTHEDLYEGQAGYELSDASSVSDCLGNPNCEFPEAGETPYTSAAVTSPRYVLPMIGGKDYKGIDVSFDLPDDFEFDFMSFQMSPDPIFTQAELIDLTSVCLSDPVYVNYYLNYPVVVRARDPDTGIVFQFATSVYVLNNRPGTWLGEPAGPGGEEAGMCQSSDCEADIRVEDSAGAALSGVSVGFMGCNIGKTDSAGGLEAGVPCGIGELKAYKRGYGEYREMASSTALSGKTITMYRMPAFEARIHQVEVQQFGDEYIIYSDAVSLLDEGMHAEIIFYPEAAAGERYQMAFDREGALVSYVPVGGYMVAGNLREGADVLGRMIDYIALSEDDEGGEIHFYIPRMPAFLTGGEVSGAASDMVRMSNLLMKCGIDPVSREDIREIESCMVDINDPEL